MTRITFAALAAAFLLACPGRRMEVVAERDLQRNPPIAAEVTAEPLGGENVRLQVRFEGGPVPPVMRIDSDRGPVALRDDGEGADRVARDGVFSANTTLPRDFLADRAAAAQRLARGERAMVFRNRELVEVAPAQANLLKVGQKIPSPFDFPPGIPFPIDAGRSLFILDLAVVNDPTRHGSPCTENDNPAGPWSFAHLMTEIANEPESGVSPSTLVTAWLEGFSYSLPVNGDLVPKDSLQGTLDEWRKRSGSLTLDLTKAPFRLVAIVNRLDLGRNPAYGASSPGELRFIFRFVGFDCDATVNFNIIFEYGVPEMSCTSRRLYAKKWVALSAMPLGSPQFNAALQLLTDPVVTRGAGGAKPNGSALNQLRTNHEFGPMDWQLREFQVELPSHQLRLSTTKQTPRHVLNATKTTTDYVTQNAAAIKNGTYVVPEQFPAGTPFLGAHSFVNPSSFWDGNPPVSDAEARHLFSLGTCNGCHGAETLTIFSHIATDIPHNGIASVSEFLTGVTVGDPVTSQPRTFNDLLRRRKELAAVANTPCIIQGLFKKPLNMVH